MLIYEDHHDDVLPASPLPPPSRRLAPRRLRPLVGRSVSLWGRFATLGAFPGLFRAVVVRNVARLSALAWLRISVTLPGGLGAGAVCAGVREVVACAAGSGTRWFRHSARYATSMRGSKSGLSHCLTTSMPFSLNSPPTYACINIQVSI